MLHLDPATTTSPLSTAGQIQGDASFYSGIGQQRADLNLDHLARGFKNYDGF
jgi:hypothetical protein